MRKTINIVIPPELSPKDKEKILESLIFIKEKKDGTIKGRACAEGINQRKYAETGDLAIPKLLIEANTITAELEAK